MTDLSVQQLIDRLICQWCTRPRLRALPGRKPPVGRCTCPQRTVDRIVMRRVA